MKVYVAMRGCYSDKYFAGVYDSLERALAVFPGDEWEHSEQFGWNNELDWDDFVTITEEEVRDEGPVRIAEITESDD